MELPAPLPAAQSTFVHGPASAWQEAWAQYVAGAHQGDVWTPESWDKPLTLKEIRGLRAFVGQQPVGRAKFVALPHADTLTREVANSLLKLLEEPPPNLFILMFGVTDRMLVTIRSRVQVISLKGEAGSETPLATFYANLNPLAQPELAKRFLYYAPLLHTTVQTDILLDAFSS
jgi:hypothetical protein